MVIENLRSGSLSMSLLYLKIFHCVMDYVVAFLIIIVIIIISFSDTCVSIIALVDESILFP